MHAPVKMTSCHSMFGKVRVCHILAHIRFMKCCSPQEAHTQKTCYSAEAQHNPDCSFMLSSCEESITLLKELHALQQSICMPNSLHKISSLSHNRIPHQESCLFRVG